MKLEHSRTAELLALVTSALENTLLHTGGCMSAYDLAARNRFCEEARAHLQELDTSIPAQVVVMETDGNLTFVSDTPLMVRRFSRPDALYNYEAADLYQATPDSVWAGYDPYEVPVDEAETVRLMTLPSILGPITAQEAAEVQETLAQLP